MWPGKRERLSKCRFGFFIVKKRHLIPTVDRVHFQTIALKVAYVSSRVSANSRPLLSERLIQFPLVVKVFFRIERAGVQHSYLLAIRSIHAEDPYSTR